MDKELILSLLLAIQAILALAFALIVFRMSYVILSFRNPLPFVPTKNKIASAMAKLANLKPGEKAIDLGSGEGHLLIGLNKMYPDNEILGVEKSTHLILISRLMAKIRGKNAKNIKVIKQDIFQIDLSPYDAVVCFLTTKVLEQLASSFINLKPGSRIITHMFAIPGRQPTETHLIGQTKIFVYKF